MVDAPAGVAETVLWGVVSGVARGIVGTPLDAWAIAAITQRDSVGAASLRRLYSSNAFFRGVIPNTIRTTVRSPVHYVSLEIGSAAYASAVSPTTRSRFPALRGVVIGVGAALAETVVNTPLRVAQTLAVNGDSLRAALRSEGVLMLARGFDGTLVHRLLSGAVFYGAYEQAIALGAPSSAAALLAGTAQVACSSPFFAVAVHKQKLQERASGNVFSLAAALARERGVWAGLFLPGLAPRLLHSWLVSPLVMWVIDVKLRALQR